MQCSGNCKRKDKNIHFRTRPWPSIYFFEMPRNKWFSKTVPKKSNTYVYKNIVFLQNNSKKINLFHFKDGAINYVTSHLLKTSTQRNRESFCPFSEGLHYAPKSSKQWHATETLFLTIISSMTSLRTVVRKVVAKQKWCHSGSTKV